ncbi:MAG: hypothetical protein AAF449_17320 [Myxococcota bacterium]
MAQGLDIHPDAEADLSRHLSRLPEPADLTTTVHEGVDESSTSDLMTEPFEEISIHSSVSSSAAVIPIREDPLAQVLSDELDRPPWEQSMMPSISQSRPRSSPPPPPPLERSSVSVVPGRPESGALATINVDGPQPPMPNRARGRRPSAVSGPDGLGPLVGARVRPRSGSVSRRIPGRVSSVVVAPAPSPSFKQITYRQAVAIALVFGLAVGVGIGAVVTIAYFGSMVSLGESVPTINGASLPTAPRVTPTAPAEQIESPPSVAPSSESPSP